MPATLDFKVPRLVRSAAEYDAAVQDVDALLDADPPRGTVAWERLRSLSVLVEAYEEERFPHGECLAGGTPQSVVNFMLAQWGMTRAVRADLLLAA